MPPSTPTPGEQGKPTDYLANERTFLAWVRTGVTVIGLGFVVVKFGLLIREIAPRAHTGSSRLSTPTGIVLVILGGVLVALAYFRYQQADRQIASGIYRPAPFLTTALGVGIAVVAIFLAAYLAATS
jgi:putative membrane protein